MFGRKNAGVEDSLAQAQAINRSQAVIQFRLDGTILTANAIFLETFGYSLAEIQGQHHSMFVPPDERNSAAYRQFWAALNCGDFRSAQYKRIRKNGEAIWIQASYTPILDAAGKPTRVVKVATDITEQKMHALEDAGKIAAIDRSQAVIEFELDGTIITANKNFLNVMGYSLDEICGQHHSIFVAAEMRMSDEYRDGWAKLNRGEFLSGEFKRIAKDGREVWILASYNPILDDTGRPFKVVKFASDVTERKLRSADTHGQIDAIKKSQAVIEFNMDGTIRWANDKFLVTVGYSLDEIVGRHHSMFVGSQERNLADYAEFWQHLNHGDFQAGEFRRIGKNDREIWIEASYNPIFDLNGKPFKVVKFASDVTEKTAARKKAEEARGLIESVAAGSEEMSASIREISDAMTKSRETAANAVARVNDADTQAQRLCTAAQAMSGIVELINNITGQINLLALNATIESARAGEAGRGFAIVAAEVKSLANQAKQATDKIAKEIEALNEESGEVVGGLDTIQSAIRQVSEYVTSTAAAVEEQSTVTDDMSNNMQRAAAALS